MFKDRDFLSTVVESSGARRRCIVLSVSTPTEQERVISALNDKLLEAKLGRIGTKSYVIVYIKDAWGLSIAIDWCDNHRIRILKK